MTIFLFVLCIATSCALVALTIPTAQRIGAMDRPDGARRIHRAETPRLGGLGICATFLLFALPALLADGRCGAWLAGGALLCAAGVADDAHPLPFGQKLLLQAAATAVSLVFLDTPHPFFLTALPKPLALAAAMLYLMLCINALNFADGADGLSAGLSLVALGALITCPSEFAHLMLLLAATLIGFLFFNRHPAVVFMGDCGSQILGLWLGLFTLTVRVTPRAPVLLFLAMPFADTIFAVARRILRGKSPFAADRGHFHHRLLARGFSQTATVRILLFFALTLAAIGRLWLT